MDSDFQLALNLQRQFLKEFEENDQRVSNKKITDGRSLVDPGWETNDPNPDIHQLFQVFSMRFFWNKLGAVEVKWSRRMTSCAGICCYRGLRGCTVSLSLPLLKLRPRKDLIETLLHEMIHAYLFVTHNNKDRDGHGPEFHKHMYRINKEAGTNITVYHTFHDEVKHYKTHVWRCNGICKTRPPFFGLVKRAMNRAPGPNDFWYEEHRLTCGGTFSKISEPEGFKAKRRKGDPETQSTPISKGKPGDLDKYFKSSSGNLLGGSSSVQKTNLPSTKKGISSLPVKNPQSTLTKFFEGKQNKPDVKSTGSKIIGSPSSSGCSSQLNSKTSSASLVRHGAENSNIHGFTNLSQPANKGNFNSGGKFTGGRGGLKISNGGGSLLERPKPGKPNHKNADEPNPSTSTEPFSGKGYVLSSGSVCDRSKSRLLNLIAPPKSSEDCSTSTPVETLESHNSEIHCPVCNQPVGHSSVTEHLDECVSLERVMQSTQTIVIEDSDDEDENEKSEEESQKLSCPNCNIFCTQENINDHLDSCLSFD